MEKAILGRESRKGSCPYGQVETYFRDLSDYARIANIPFLMDITK